MGVLFLYEKERGKLQGMIDIHCHILPEVDDGARSVREAVQMLNMQKESGVGTVILTPHFRPGMFEPTVSQIYTSYYRLKAAAAQTGVRLLLGREYHISSLFEEHVKQRNLPVLADTDYVLAEYSSRHSYALIRRSAERMLQAGYRPVIAHIERYPALEDLEKVEELYRMGILLQINAGSVLGEETRAAKKYCRKLIEKDLIHLIASDSHRTNMRKPNLGKCCTYLSKKIGKDYAEKIFRTNPLMVIKNMDIE